MSEVTIPLKCTPDKLEEKIESIPGICSDAKKAIKELFEVSLGVEFKKAPVFFVGGIYKYKPNNQTVMVISFGGPKNGPDRKMVVDLCGEVYWPQDKKILFPEEFTFLAKNLKEYFRNNS